MLVALLNCLYDKQISKNTNDLLIKTLDFRSVNGLYSFTFIQTYTAHFLYAILVAVISKYTAALKIHLNSD